MAKLSRQTKEIIKTVIVLIIIGILLTFYVIYPLNKSKSMFSRPDLEEYPFDSLPENSIGDYIDSSYLVDSFWIDPDGLTSLACLSLQPITIDSILGSVILLHSDGDDRNDMIDLAQSLVGSGFTVFVYDQRASGLSSGKYHGFGLLEASDLQEVISTLEVRGIVTHPLYIIGEEMGGDAALITAQEESRISGVVALNPYLTTDQFINKAQVKFDSFWFPLYPTIMFWWYEMRSGYAPGYRELDDIQPAACATLLLKEAGIDNSEEEIVRLKEISDKNLLTIAEFDKNTVNKIILEFITTLK